MRYSATHKQETRERLLESSRAIAKKEGFDASGVDSLMSAIGLSGGAFYNHFASKDDLFAALVAREIENSASMLGGDASAGVEEVNSRVRSYLSSAHALHPETGCMLPSLGAEIARSAPEVRASVERSLRKLKSTWSKRLDGDEDGAWAAIAQCVGAILLSRIVESERTRREILAANRRSIADRLSP